MANDIDPRQMYEALRAFHQMEQQQSASANVVMAEMMNWLLRRIEANSEFLSMFGHIVPQPMAEAAASSAPPGQGQTPPPVPPPTSLDAIFGPDPGDRDPDDEAFETRIAEMRRGYPRSVP